MRQLQPVIWSKGTFLSPQHLQAQERFVEDSVRFYMESLGPHAWGFSTLQLNAVALASGMLSLTSATGIFPDSLLFDLSNSDPAPQARALDKSFTSGIDARTFYLAIPEYRQGEMNVSINRGRIGTRFTSHVQLTRDENGGGSREKPVQVAHKNLQLIAEGENLEGSVVLPCARILKTVTGTYIADPEFVPPMLSLKAGEAVRSGLRSLIEALVTRGSQIAGGRGTRNQSLAEFSASDVAEFWLLYTINSHLPGLRHLHESGNVAPQRLFDELSGLAGSLTTFSRKTEKYDRIDPRDLPLYSHEQPGPCFNLLYKQIGIMLDNVIDRNFIALPLRQVRDTVYATEIDKDAYLEGTRLYLAVAADLPAPEIIDRAPKLMKLSSATRVEGIIAHAVRGLRLTYIAQPPRAIPVKLGYHLFSIEQSGEHWEYVRNGRSFAVYVSDAFRNPQMELVVLLPNAGGI